MDINQSKKYVWYSGHEWWSTKGLIFSTKMRQGTLTHIINQSCNLSFSTFYSISWTDANIGASQQHSRLGMPTNKQKTWKILTSQEMLWDDKCNSYKMLALIIFGTRQSVYSSPEWWFAGSLLGKDLSGSFTGKQWDCLCESRILWPISFLVWFPFGLVVGTVSRSPLV